MAPTVNGINWLEIKPFNMRNETISNFVINEKKTLYRAHGLSVNRFREEYLVRDADKSITVLRQLLQDKINSEIDSILQKYYSLFFKPAISNIRNNLKDKINDINEKDIFRDILEDAKKMYCQSEMTPHEDNDETPMVSQFQCHRTRGRPAKAKYISREVKKYKTNSTLKKKLKIKDKTKFASSMDELAKNNEIESYKLDQSRLNIDTLFILGSKVNKALGFGTTRGRLFSRHTNLFRYIADQEDKEWLIKNQLMPSTGVKVYLLIKEDIMELINSKEYKDIPGISEQDLDQEFTVPQNIIDKMTTVMTNMRKRIHHQRVISDADCTFKGSISELSTFDSDLSSSFDSTLDIVTNCTDNSQS